jgi:hypothetical protein
MKRALKVAAVLAAVAMPLHAAQTNVQLITHVLYDGNTDYAYFVGQGVWVSQGCSSFYATIPGTQPGKQQLLALATAAYAAGKRVSFYGECQANNPNYFHVTYITVQD